MGITRQSISWAARWFAGVTFFVGTAIAGRLAASDGGPPLSLPAPLPGDALAF